MSTRPSSRSRRGSSRCRRSRSRCPRRCPVLSCPLVVPLPPVATTVLLIAQLEHARVVRGDRDLPDLDRRIARLRATRMPSPCSRTASRRGFRPMRRKWSAPRRRCGPPRRSSAVSGPAHPERTCSGRRTGMDTSFVVRVRVSPVGDVRLPVVEENAFDDRQDTLRLRLLLGLVRDQAGGGAAARHGHVDRGALPRDLARTDRAADRRLVVAELGPVRARLAHRVAPRVDRDRVGRAAVSDCGHLGVAADLEVELAGIGARDEALDHRDRGLAACRALGGLRWLAGQVPRDRASGEPGPDDVVVPVGIEGRRLATAADPPARSSSRSGEGRDTRRCSGCRSRSGR